MTDYSCVGSMMPLSDEETVLVAGGDYTGSEFGGDFGEGGGGINSLLNLNTALNLTPDRGFVSSNGYVAADYNNDGVYDQAWTTSNGGCYTSTDGQHWISDDGPDDDLLVYAEMRGWIF